MDAGTDPSIERGLSIDQAVRRPDGARAWRTLLPSAVVCASYYAGSRLGVVLRIPPATTSVLWPPNAILTAGLLLTPFGRRWLVLLAAALPAHIAVLQGVGWPPTFVLSLFVTNCSEAVAAASLLRLFGGTPIHFGKLRGVALFLLSTVLLAPLLSCFPDAAMVALFRGEDFWAVWHTRFFSNTVTALALVPCIVMLVQGGVADVRRWPVLRTIEAIVLGTITLLLSVAVFLGHADGRPGWSTGIVTVLLAPLLWGALRFGPAGASFCLLTVVTVALWASIHGLGPFTDLPPGQGSAAFQSLVLIVGIPLLALAAMVRERVVREELLEERLAFVALVSELSGAFVEISSDRMNEAFDTWLARLGEAFRLDGLVVFRPQETGRVTCTSSWFSPRLDPKLTQDLVRATSECAAHVLARCGQLDIPLVGAGRVLGTVTFLRPPSAGGWSEELRHRLGLVADVLANAFARKDSEDALRASEAMKSAILSSLPAGVAVLDEQGRILAVSEGWTRFGTASHWGASVEVGESYLEVCRNAAANGSPEAREMLTGIRAVLDGSRGQFTGERSAMPGAEQWFRVTAVPFFGPRTGAVVCYTDVTDTRRAESEAQATRQELAHLLRASTVAAMASSIAHELNQPLAAILANAQVAQQQVKVGALDVIELGEILADIVEQDKRAGDVIARLRELLRKGDTRRAALDVSMVVQDVIRLLGSDSLIRKIGIRSHFDAAVPAVLADRTQLQQVVLNLMLNAMDAVAAAPGAERMIEVSVRATTAPAPGVEVGVRDRGLGLDPGLEHAAFEPFFTTKPGGMGMGLSISRSIIVAHGGRIWAHSNPGRGADFRFFLPALPS
jgi:two-component system sensor kinase FixL